MTSKEIMQQAFDTAAKHLLTQGCKSREGDQCLYRGPNGLKCAVGVFIPDDEYSPLMDTLEYGVPTDAYELVCRFPGAVKIGDHIVHPGAEELALLSALQATHDRNDPGDWPRLLQGVAAGYGLSDHVLGENAAGGE